MNLYVYFKFIVADHPQVLKRIREMHDQLSLEFPGLFCDLLKRPLPDQEGRETWMEVYRGLPTNTPGFNERLLELVLSKELPQPRRNEVFIPME